MDGSDSAAMKMIPVILLVCCSFALVGCESLSNATDSVRAKLASREQPRTKTFSAAPRETYEAAKKVRRKANSKP